MTEIGILLILLAVGAVTYPYILYPATLKVLGWLRRSPEGPPAPADDRWPMISITVAAYNEEHQIAETVESLLALDYPEERREIVIVSDASEDRTDEIVRSYTNRGVVLIRLAERGGKTAAENTAATQLRGEIVVNTDASIRIHPHALKPIIAPFADPSVGLTSGRDVSAGPTGQERNQGEAGYVGYEMWVRDLETRASGIVGASGCFYAIRRDLHAIELPPSLSRDFAAALHARERGYRAISVPDATCTVPRTGSLAVEYRRKVRTITRGMETLLHKRSLLNPLRYGLFAWQLISHKVCRWLMPWAALCGVVGLAFLAVEHVWLRPAVGGLAIFVGLAALVWALAPDRPLPRILALPSFLLMANVAASHAALRVLTGDREPTWEPTRRTPTTGG